VVVVTGHADGATHSFTVLLKEPQPPQPPPSGPGERPPAPRPMSPAAAWARGAAVEVSRVALRSSVLSMPRAALPWAAVEELIEPGGGAAGRAGADAGLGGGVAAGGGMAEPGAAAVGGDAGYRGPPAPIMHILPFRFVTRSLRGHGGLCGHGGLRGAVAGGAVVTSSQPLTSGRSALCGSWRPSQQRSMAGCMSQCACVRPTRPAARLAQKPTGRRHLLVLDRAGNVRLDRDNGTVRYFARTNRTQLAVRFGACVLLQHVPGWDRRAWAVLGLARPLLSRARRSLASPTCSLVCPPSRFNLQWARMRRCCPRTTSRCCRPCSCGRRAPSR
jgi:hypothetical protein